MNIDKSIAAKIEEVKGKLTYRELSTTIEIVTGQYISPSSLHKYITSQRIPSHRQLEIIAKYADKPMEYFFGSDDAEGMNHRIAQLEHLLKVEQGNNLASREEIKQLKEENAQLKQMLATPNMGVDMSDS